MAEIRLNGDWRLCTDIHCWSVQRYRGKYPDDHKKRPGEEKWESVSYHQTLEGAMASCVEKQVRISDARGWDGVLAEYRRATEEIGAAVAAVRDARAA